MAKPNTEQLLAKIAKFANCKPEQVTLNEQGTRASIVTDSDAFKLTITAGEIARVPVFSSEPPSAANEAAGPEAFLPGENTPSDTAPGGAA